MKVSQLKQNPRNPRKIEPEKIDKLVESLRSFPEMMEKRPIVCVTDVDGKLYPLGGNQRLKAIKQLDMKEIPDNWVVLADDWSEEQRQEFLIKDNVAVGEWDWEMLKTDWDTEQLSDWSLDMPKWEEQGVDLDSDEFGTDFSLKDGDKAPFQQMTFTLADEQAEQIKNAIADIKQTDEYKYAETMGNENSNGNALYLIVMQWVEQRK